MAEIINNQPVSFNNYTQCGVRESSYSQLVQCGDITQFQFLLNVCAAEKDMIVNGSFADPTPSPWDADGFGWVYSTITNTYNHNSGFQGTLRQWVNVADGETVRIVFTIEAFDTGGHVIFQAGLYYEVFYEAGTYVRYIIATSLTHLKWTVSPASNASFAFVSMHAVNTNFGVQIIDSNDNTVFSFDRHSHPDYFKAFHRFITISYDWLGKLGECLADGCYRIGVSDPCNCGNGGFVAMDFITVQNQWFIPLGGWIIEYGVANFTGTPLLGATAEVQDVVCNGVTYEVKYTLSGMAGNRFKVRLGAASGSWQTADGDYTEIITATSSIGEVVMFGESTGVASAFQVTDFSVEQKIKTVNYLSNTFQLYQEAPCSVVVAGCCDNDCLGHGFVDTGFRPQIRLAALYGQGHYLSREEAEERSNGWKGLYYYRNRPIRLLKFAAPQYVHDFMATLRGYDHVFIDDVAIAWEGEGYDKPNYVGDFNYADVILEVSEKQVLIEKRRPNNKVKSCAVDGQGLLLGMGKPSGYGGKPLILATGRKTLLITG